MRQLIIIAHNLRSTHNVGALLRTSDGLGISNVWLTGYTPFPKSENDSRLPHLAQKIDKQIAKTALGAEKSVTWHQSDDIYTVLEQLKHDGFMVVALEQAPNSILLPDFNPPEKLAMIIGREVEGVEQDLLDSCDQIIEIPMFGKKESYNVAAAAAMALYSIRFAA